MKSDWKNLTDESEITTLRTYSELGRLTNLGYICKFNFEAASPAALCFAILGGHGPLVF